NIFVIQCLIIENNLQTIEKIKSVGIEFANITFLNVKEDHDTILNDIIKFKPEVVFVNIDLPKVDFAAFFLDVLNHVDERPYFVALSSIKEKAYEAYRYDFSDFLLKPLNELS